MKEKIAWLLRAISLGKYNTTLYNKSGSTSISSVKGGIITLMLVLAIIGYSISVLSSTFARERYNLDMQTQEISGLDLSPQNESMNNSVCSSGNC
jgi:hypothetical protein